MEYYDCTKEAGRKAIDERLNEIQLPVSNTPAVPPPADVNAFCRDMEEQSNANNILKQALKPKPSAPKQPVAKKRNRKYKNNMHYTQEQRDYFAKLFKQNGKRWTTAQYALKVGVSSSAITDWRRLLKEGKSLVYCSTRNAHRNLLNDNEVVAISNIIENGGQEFTQAKMSEELKKRFPDCPKVSTSTICRAMHSKRMTVLVGRDYTWKVGSRRGPGANCPENKDRRIAVTAQLNDCLRRGKIWVAIDETHWTLQSRRRKAYSKRGTKAFVVSLPWKTEISALVAIDHTGQIGNVTIVKGHVDAPVFIAFFKTLAEKYKDKDVVFFLDNAPIHKKEELIGVHHYERHEILFNAPYSEETNPIEMFFAEWKRIVDDRVKIWPGLHRFIEILHSTVMGIDESIIRAEFAKVKESIFEKVATRHDM